MSQRDKFPMAMRGELAKGRVRKGGDVERGKGGCPFCVSIM